MGSISTNGITIGYDEAGGGEDVLVLIHGHPFDRSMWRRQLEAASQAGWRAIAPDLRGYGESTVVPGKTGLDVFARDLAALLDALGVRHAVVAGLSMGGQVAMEFARSYAARLRGIVLAATFPCAETEGGKRERHAAADRVLREGMGPYAEELLPKLIAPHNAAARPELALRVLAMMRQTHPQGAAAALRGRAERPSYEDVLARLEVPALIVVGDQDAFTTRADAERMRALLRRSELAWMKDVGHLPNLEREAEFSAALVRFLGSVAA